MMSAPSYKSTIKPDLVIGLGETGWSVVQYLQSQGVDCEVIDTRAEPPMLSDCQQTYPALPVSVGCSEFPDFANYRRVIASPGIATPSVDAIGDIELFANALVTLRESSGRQLPVIAITGSNGKSTVTTLVGEMLTAAGLHTRVGGNLSPPALSLLDDASAVDAFVLELSSFQLETTFRLDVAAAALLNISPDHMNRYADDNAYMAAKMRIFDHAQHCVLNRLDDNFAAASAALNGQKVWHFGLDDTSAQQSAGLRVIDGENWLVVNGEAVCRTDQITMQGDHNILNVMAAVLLIKAANLPLPTAAIAAALSFKGLRHRCELVMKAKGVRWINDSKGTNVGATVAALDGFAEPVVLIAGGDGKGADFSELAHRPQRKPKAVVVLGADAAAIAEAFAGVCKVYQVSELAAAIAQASQLSRAGDAVLFSPACASFDMFDSYQHRGDVYCDLVRAHHG